MIAPRFLLLTVVPAIAAIFYGPYLTNFFAFDDLRYLENLITGPGAIALGYNAQLRLVSNFAWVPLFWTSGFNPTGYNLFAMVIALFNALLLYRFLFRLLDREDIPILAAILFMAAPAGADAIFWKMSISTLLSLFFDLITLNLYVAHRKTGVGRYYAAACGVFLLAIFSKDDAAALVAILVAIELLFFRGWDEKRQMVRRILPFIGIVGFFLTVTSLTYKLLNLQSETWGAFKIRPFYSLLGGFTAFFIGPDGFLNMTDPRIYGVAILVPAFFWFSREKKIILFGCIWLIVTFLPSSLTTIAQFHPNNFPNSISRFLYTPSAGVAVLLATALAGFRPRLGTKPFYVVCALFLVIFLSVNSRIVHMRGEQWQQQSAPLKTFLDEIQGVYLFPRNSHVFVAEPPAGRAFVQQGLRAFYRNPTITWIADPQNYRVPPGEFGYFIACEWYHPEKVRLTVFDFQTGQTVARSKY